MIVGVPSETRPDERRVALTPHAVQELINGDGSVIVERSAGERAGYGDDAYQQAGAKLVENAARVFDAAQVICQVRTYGANPQFGDNNLAMLTDSHIVIGHCDPLGDQATIERLAQTGATSMALELVPRITRAQAMDVLSSQSNIAGYKAVLVAASELPRMMPMMMTAAGTITPARAFIIGAGVAGLQAIATARRLGAVVTAFDVRPAVKEQVESLGATFLEIEMDTADAEDKGGYAKAMADDAIDRQRKQMGDKVADSDIVITTAAVPGRTAPVLVTTDMIRRMRTGSVIIDLAAERGGNCEPSKPDERVEESGVTVLGPTNLAATVPYHASQVYARNIIAYLGVLMDDSGTPQPASDDEIIKQTLLTQGGEIMHSRVRETFNMPALQTASAEGQAT